MHKYVFLTNQYLPKPGATGMCVHALAKELFLEGNEVHVICYNDGRQSCDVIDGINIHRIQTPYFLKDSSSLCSVRRGLLRIMSLCAKLLFIKEYPMRSHRLRNNYIKSCKALISCNSNIWTVISTYTPIEACSALLSIKTKYPNVKACFYSTDTLSHERGETGFLPVAKRERKGLLWEKRLFSAVDLIIIMECHATFYQSDIFRDFKDKMVFANFPFIIKPRVRANFDTYKNSSSRGQTLIVYAGSLYRILRNPECACKALSSISKEKNIKAIFMGGGDCADLIMQYQTATQNKIEYLGMQSHDVVERYLADADVLLSIGNKNSPMAPSKIYEYIATGKPIIHFYSWDNDPCIEPLNKYGNALSVSENDPGLEMKISVFLDRYRIIPFDVVSSLFYTSTPKYTVKFLEDC